MKIDFNRQINRKNTDCSKWDGQGGDYIPLWVADMDFPVAEPVLEALKKRLEHPSKRLLSFVSDLALFKEYHAKYPSHGYRWLNAKIRLDTGLKMSDQYAHKCCKTAGIMSISKHYRYKKPGDPFKVYPNLMATGLNITGPLQCITSDMTAFRLKGVYYELTLYMDLWNNEILSYSL